MLDLIQTSIALNNFSTSHVRLINKAVHSLPSGSFVTFSQSGGETVISNGTSGISTIRLDDVEWPSQSSILMLKVDVEGLELEVLRSAEKLFREKRIHHLIFEYTTWWTDRASQRDLIPFVKGQLGAKKLFALDRTGSTVYGPLTRKVLDRFHNYHVKQHLQTDIYASFVEFSRPRSSQLKPYILGKSFA